MESKLLTINEFCERNKVKRSKVYRLLAEGNLEALKIGKSTRISIEQEARFHSRLRPYTSKRQQS